MPANHYNRALKKAGKRACGYITIEILLAFMILVIASLAVIQYGIAMIVKPNIVHAATVAARELAKGADEDEVIDALDTILGAHVITIGAGASTILETPLNTYELGTATVPCEPPSFPDLGEDEVLVTVCVDMGNKPFLNILPTYGINFADKKMKSFASARLE